MPYLATCDRTLGTGVQHQPVTYISNPLDPDAPLGCPLCRVVRALATHFDPKFRGDEGDYAPVEAAIEAVLAGCLEIPEPAADLVAAPK